MRFIGLDVGRDFAHVAVVDGSGTARRLPRLAMGDHFRGFATTLGPDDTVALEASTNTWALADLLARHAGSVVVSNPLRTRAIASAKRKTDDTMPPRSRSSSRPTTCRRSGSPTRRRAGCAGWCHTFLDPPEAVAPVTDLFGARGRALLAALELPVRNAWRSMRRSGSTLCR